jgi:hypothetical protein
MKGRFWQTDGMSGSHDRPEIPSSSASAQHTPPVAETQAPPAPVARPREIGGRPGPDPVRYGDWEKAGRCIDF